MYAPEFEELVSEYESTGIEFPALKPITLAMWILESGRGSSRLAKDHLNFAGMKYRSEITAYCKRVSYEAHDGSSYYCEFPDLQNFIQGFWAFLDRSPYDGWRNFSDDPLKFIEHVGPTWAGDPNYVDKVKGLLSEAEALLGVQTDTGSLGAPGASSGGSSALIPGRPTISLSADGKIAKGGDGLDIVYRGVDSCPYGKTATNNKKDFAGIILHHTSPKHTTEWYVQYQIDGDAARGGHFGYHFYISPAGVIYQGAPLTKRTNHVSPKSAVRNPFQRNLNNVNAIGITCARAGLEEGFSPTDEQRTQAKALIFALCDAFEIPFLNVAGHGEVQNNRHKTEGRSIATAVRSWAS